MEPIHFQIDDFLDSAIAALGDHYFRNGFVRSLETAGPMTWRAEVGATGRRSHIAEVSLDVTSGGYVQEIDASCSCRSRDECAHVAATLLAVTSLHADERQRSAAPPSTAQGWLQALENTLDAPQQGLGAPADGDLAYLLVPYDKATLTRVAWLHLGRVRGRKNLKFTPGRGPTDPLWHRDDRHVRVGSILLAIFPPRDRWNSDEESESHFVEHPLLGALVRAMARTGRLYWDTNATQPLVWAAQREISLSWQVSPAGQMQLGLHLESGVRVIGGEDPVYIDPGAHQVGPLRHAIPSGVLDAVDKVPPLALAEAEAFRAQLSERMRAFIPPPPDITVRQESRPLEPELVIGPANPSTPHRVGSINFRYGDQVVPADAPGDAISYLDGDTLIQVPRQKQAEAAALKNLGPRHKAGSVLLGCMDTVQGYAEEIEKLQPLIQSGWRLQEGSDAVRTVVDVSTPVELEVEDGAGSAWFELRMGVEVEGEQVDLAPLLAAAIERPEIGLQGVDWDKLGPRVYLPLDSQRIIAMPTVRLKPLLTALQELLTEPGLGLGQAVELTHLLDTGHCTLRGRAFVMDLARRLRACEGAVTQPPPAGLQATLRPYQQHGLNWLAFLRAHELGGILADDMGLGKTLQTVAHLLAVHESGTAQGAFLVVMPTSLLFNWGAELKRFAPGLRVRTHYGPDRCLDDIQDAHVVLTSYGTLLRDAEALSAMHFDTLVLDEAHAIKNPRTKLHHAVREVQATHRLCLTGTPLQNNLEELWAQFAFLMPALLNTHTHFGQNFRGPIERQRDPTARNRLAARVRPFILRRQKADVAHDLPAKTDMVERLELVGAQRDLYETVRNLMDARVRQALANRGLAQSKIIVLDALLKLRQVCCDPRLVKITQAKRAKTSAKLQRLLELLHELSAEGRRVLVFSQFTSMLALIAEALDKQGIAYVTLTGKTRDRAAVVQDFQKGATPVFLLSLKAGGVGLNLTAADTVIHYDPWWNPAAEQQATDRAHRIGQDKPVFVYKLIAAGSVEERILGMQERKQQLVSGVLDAGALEAQLTSADLEQLFAPLEG